MDGKYKSQKLHFKVPNVLIIFSNGKPDQNKLSKDRWTILKISKDSTELTYIDRRKLEKRKEQITDFGAVEVEPEKENIDSDASGKRKSSERKLMDKCLQKWVNQLMKPINNLVLEKWNLRRKRILNKKMLMKNMWINLL